MITHNNFNYFITYILFSCIGHEEVLFQFQQTLAPSLGAHCSKTIFYSTLLPLPRVATQLHIPYWSILIDNSFYCSTNHFIV